MSEAKIEEMQGLYGPFSLFETVLQKIWQRGDYHSRGMKTVSGRSLKVIEPGRWNSNEGPDFKEAVLEINGQRLVGDVEVHFRSSDWHAHGHDRNPNFSQVVLHVLLYEPDPLETSIEGGLEAVCLLPILNCDLESYAMEEALLELERVEHVEWLDAILKLPVELRLEAILGFAKRRWSYKVAFAEKRLKEQGWNHACHQFTLEVLGYARNRAPMSRIASKYSLTQFSAGLDTDRLFSESRDQWKLKGARPANHPRLRLQQYAEICRICPYWPEKLMEIFSKQEKMDVHSGSAFRKLAATKQLQRLLAKDVFCSQLGEKRLNTLLCDAIFPLAQAKSLFEGEPFWQNWYPGDMPLGLVRAFDRVGLSKGKFPKTNGLLQGILELATVKSDELTEL